MASVTRLDSVVQDVDSQLEIVTSASLENNALPNRNATSHGAGERVSKPQHMTDFMDAILKLRSVEGVMMMDKGGKVGKSSFDDATSSVYCGVSSQMLRTVIPLIQKHSPKNRLHTIRSNGGGKELIIAPIENQDFTFVIVQRDETIAEDCSKPEVVDKGHGPKKRDSATTASQPSPRLSTAMSTASKSGAGSGRATVSSAPSSPPSQKPSIASTSAKSVKSSNANANVSISLPGASSSMAMAAADATPESSTARLNSSRVTVS